MGARGPLHLLYLDGQTRLQGHRGSTFCVTVPLDLSVRKKDASVSHVKSHQNDGFLRLSSKPQSHARQHFLPKALADFVLLFSSNTEQAYEASVDQVAQPVAAVPDEEPVMAPAAVTKRRLGGYVGFANRRPLPSHICSPNPMADGLPASQCLTRSIARPRARGSTSLPVCRPFVLLSLIVCTL